MFNKQYSNFVRPEPTVESSGLTLLQHKLLNGDEARKIYLEELKETKNSRESSSQVQVSVNKQTNCARQSNKPDISDKDLFLIVQNDNVDTLKEVLHHWPDKINKVDEFGWSLLMIACQANSVETVKELLKRGVNRDIRDKAGNSAQSLVIKNKNYKLAGILLSFKNRNTETKVKKKSITKSKAESYFCDCCKIKCANREEHLSSTIHNINLSKDKKIPTNYVIPESNRGYQILLKVGWDRDSGLGPDGSGKKYPIKTVQKKDRKGLGHGKMPQKCENEQNRKFSGSKLVKKHESSKKLEINFRRQFY